MSALIQAISENRFLILGRAGMDMFATPLGTKSTEAETFTADLGGSSANICVGLCTLGGKAALLTTVSDDAVGRFCVNKLQHYGVKTDHIRYVGGEYRTSLAVYESRIEDFQNVIYRNGAADFQVEKAQIDAVDYTEYSCLITTGTVFAAEPSRGATFHAFNLAQKANMPIIFDIDYRPYSWSSAEFASEVLTRAATESDAIIGNDEEFDFMAGGQGLGLEMARHLATTTDKLIIYKMGEKGAVTFYQGEEICTGIYPVTAVKPNGAGDSFISGLLMSLATGFSLHDAVLRGSACASIVVSKAGCAPAMPNIQQLEDFLSTANEAT